jgi:hypothetical protein
MWLSRKNLFLCVALIALFAGVANAQTGVVSIQRVDGLISGSSVQAGANLRFLLKYQNLTGQRSNVSNGFKFSSPDGATWDSTTVDSIGPINDGGTPGDPTDDFASYFLRFFDITYAFNEFNCDGQDDTIGFIGAGNPTSANRQMPTTWNDSVFAITLWFNGDKSSAGKHICIDSALWFDGGTWVWVGRNLVDYFPEWQGLPGQVHNPVGIGPDRKGSGYCFEIYAPALGLSVDSLGFSAIAGGVAPPSQTFVVNSTGDGAGDHLAFTLVENASWLVKSPSSGTTPRTVTVSVNTTGLVPGVYIDSIEVQSAAAFNSPVYEKVTLTLAAPSPVISSNKSSFSFVALTGGANPASQTMTISNTGGGTLNWTSTNSSLWLNVNPSFGGNSTLVTVSADITGLGVGDHFDTIIVSDPAALNLQIKIPVKLSLGSSLPMIAVDSAVNHIIVDAPDNAPDRAIYIRNAGVGSMTYTLSETSTRLFTVSPMSGSVPDSIHLTFKVLGGVVGQEYFDTLWVSSPEAINSPYPVVFHFRIVDEPAVIATNKDTIKFTTYGCKDLGEVLPVTTFAALNSGGDNPKVANISYSSDFFTVSPLSGTMTRTFNVASLYPNVAPGVYYDTIIVSADFAYNSPCQVIVQYTRIDSVAPATIVITEPTFDIPHQMQTGPVAISTELTNSGLGCMPWTLDEEISWFTPDHTSGNVPTIVSGIVLADDLAFGTHSDSFYVHSSWAGNSPQKIKVTMRMWLYHGDMNWDGRIDLSDISWMVNYMLLGNPQPRPEYVVGDTDCSGTVDLSDLSRLVAYMTVTGTTICGNP